MSQTFTKSMARNIFYGGSLFFFLLFIALSVDTSEAIPKQNAKAIITPQVAMGKRIWEDNDCIGCHTILGEGAYFAPELGNVYKRFGNSTDAIKAFIKSRPKNGIPGRRSMPQFNFNEKQLSAIAAFLKYASEIDTNGWPPNIQG